MNPESKVAAVLIGAALTRVERLPHNYWVFHFENNVRLNVEAPWRLISQTSILVTREDDGQKFGLPVPVDAEAELRKTVEGHRVTAATANRVTSDLTLQFENSLTLEIFNDSSGYESWTLDPDDGPVIVGRNG